MTTLAKARALIEACHAPPRESREYNRFIGELRRDSPAIAEALVEAVELIRAGLAESLREDEAEDLVDRARAFLAKHDPPG